MSYRPPGWTEERLAAATYDDLAGLPYETLHLITPTAVTLKEAQDLIFGARIDARLGQDRQRLGLEPIPPRFKPDANETDPGKQESMAQRNKQFIAREREMYEKNPSAPLVPEEPPAKRARRPAPRDPVVQVVEEDGYDDFGFMVVRVDYSDDDEWEAWSAAFEEQIDQSLQASAGGDRVADKLLTAFVADAELDGATLGDVQRYHESLEKSDMVKPGLDSGMVLVADKNAVESLLSKSKDDAWVWAVDLGFPFKARDKLPAGDPPTMSYPGYFRVAPSAALTELWPMLKRGSSGKSLWYPDVKVWTGMKLF